MNRELQPGDVCQYRKVGRVVLLRRASDYQGWATDWRVRFLTGCPSGDPKREHVHTVWVSPNDRIESKS